MKHVVVGIVTKINEEGNNEYLLVSSKKDYGEFTGFYYPPGGKIEEGESEQEALVREMEEELSLKVIPIEKITETGADVPDQITYWWKCEVLDNELKINNEELADARYFTPEEIKELKLWPATENFFKEYIFNEIKENREIKRG